MPSNKARENFTIIPEQRQQVEDAKQALGCKSRAEVWDMAMSEFLKKHFNIEYETTYRLKDAKEYGSIRHD